jgi:hypothetical protein
MASSSSHSSKPAPLADSPWFWLGLFSLTAVVAILAIGPKFYQRQQRLERQSHVREQVWRQRAEQPKEKAAPAEGTREAADNDPYPSEVRNRLWPLAVLGAAVTIGCWGWLWWQRRSALNDRAPPGMTQIE